MALNSRQQLQSPSSLSGKLKLQSMHLILRSNRQPGHNPSSPSAKSGQLLLQAGRERSCLQAAQRLLLLLSANCEQQSSHMRKLASCSQLWHIPELSPSGSCCGSQ